MRLRFKQNFLGERIYECIFCRHSYTETYIKQMKSTLYAPCHSCQRTGDYVKSHFKVDTPGRSHVD